MRSYLETKPFRRLVSDNEHSRKQMETYELLQHHVETCYWGSEYENLPKEPKKKLTQAADGPVFTRKEKVNDSTVNSTISVYI